MSIFILEVTTAAERDRFIKLPWKIYKDDPHWVPPLLIDKKKFLDPRKNPFFKSARVKLYLAYDDAGGAVGRIAAIVSDNHLKIHNDGAGFFGLFECVNDTEVAGLLFNTAAAFLRSQGMRIMRGPLSMNINDELGLLISGFNSPPVVLMPHNPSYYERLVEGYGFKKEIDWFAYYLENHDGAVPERLRRGAQLARKRYGFTIRAANMKHYDEEIKKIQDIYNRAWEKNWGAVPLTDEEFHHLAQDLKMIAVPELVLFAEVEGKTVGVSLALPDFNQVFKRIKNGRLLPFGIFKFLWYKRKIDMLRLTIMGVLKEYRHMGIETCFIHDTYAAGLKMGAWRCEMSQIVENNVPMNNVLIKMGTNVYKTYRVYKYDLQSASGR
jgi:hypothetical protein